MPEQGFRFQVAFSFAGPHREKMRTIAELVASRLGRERVFFDEWYEHEILGPNMRVLLQRIYYQHSLMVVADVSREYADRPWTQAEAEAIDALRMSINSAEDEIARLRLINVRFDAVEMPGIFENNGWIDAQEKSVEQIAGILLGRHELLVNRMLAETSLTSATLTPPILFVHPATNDELYSRREKELDWLDECAKDQSIRIATVTGIGGLGKTSLVGHWIQKHKGWRFREARGILFYSFYSNRDPRALFDALLTFVCETEGICEIPTDQPLHHLAAAAMRRWPYVLVMDGLEVLQRDEEDSHFGWIADGELTEFVARCATYGSSFIILTSRFPFPQITNEHPGASSHLELPLLTESEGADLLVTCGVAAGRRDLELYSHQFGGHPLALRIFAGACVAHPFSAPEMVSEQVRADGGDEKLPDPTEPGLSEEERKSRRQRRQFYKLLRWFQTKLPKTKCRLLQLVALFREPAPTEMLIALVNGMGAMKDDFAACGSARILTLLVEMVEGHLLQREDDVNGMTSRWSTHPIIRDVFRTSAIESDSSVAIDFAEIVAGSRLGVPRDLSELKSITDAIEVLIAAGYREEALNLFDRRLGSGLTFLNMPAPQEGLRCTRAFLQGEKNQLILSWKSVFALAVGEMEEAEQGHRESNKIAHSADDWHALTVGLQNLAEVLTLRGALKEAEKCSVEALKYSAEDEPPALEIKIRRYLGASSRMVRESHHVRYASVCRAQVLSLTGRLIAASEGFHKVFSTSDSLLLQFSRPPTLWYCEHLLCLGMVDAAEQLAASYKQLSEWSNQAHVAMCDTILGKIDTIRGQISSAKSKIEYALSVFRESRMVQEVCDALIAMARLRLASEIPNQPTSLGIAAHDGFTVNESALADCDEALRISARCGLLLRQSDALNLRAEIQLKVEMTERAHRDALRSLEIAERCGYYWARHEALRQLRGWASKSGSAVDQKYWAVAEEALSAEMKEEVERASDFERSKYPFGRFLTVFKPSIESGERRRQRNNDTVIRVRPAPIVWRGPKRKDDDDDWVA